MDHSATFFYVCLPLGSTGSAALCTFVLLSFYPWGFEPGQTKVLLEPDVFLQQLAVILSEISRIGFLKKNYQKRQKKSKNAIKEEDKIQRGKPGSNVAA